MFHRKKNFDASSVFVIQQRDHFTLARDKTSDSIDTAFSAEGFGHGQNLHTSLSLKRRRIGRWFIFFVIGLFLVRGLYLQILNGPYYHAMAEQNRYHTTRIVPPRGQILDRNGVVLAENIPSFLLTMTIGSLPKDSVERDSVINHLCETIGLQRADIDLLLTQYAKRPSEKIPILQKISFESAMRLDIDIAKFPGFELVTSTQRHYPSALLSLSHVLGYTGKITSEEFEHASKKGYRPIDVIGKTGVEKQAEDLLRGTPGKQISEVDAVGHELSVVSKTDPIAGSTLILGIDLEFQKFIEIHLADILKKVGATKGSVIAMDPNTGIIRAIVSAPSFDNNLFASGIDQTSYKQLSENPDQPLFFRAISGNYPSGSIFKPFIAYAALKEHIIDEHTSFLSVGGIHVGDWFFPDWKAGGHGVTDVRKAIAESVNTFFYMIGGGFSNVTGLGVDRIVRYAQIFGFGSKTGIDIPGESTGFLPSKDWKLKVKGERWYVGDTYHLSIGQGDFLTTPLQMAVATSTIANGGYVVRPHVIQAVEGGKTIDLSSDDRVQIQEYDANAVRIVREGMRQSVTNGSNRRLLNIPVAVAGKTGTAQSAVNRPNHSWFTGFAPYDHPTIVLTVLIEEGGESTSAAVPLADEILGWWFTHRTI